MKELFKNTWTEREMYGKRIAVYDVGVDCFLCDLP